MLKDYDNLVVIGATESDEAGTKAFREKTGADYPMVYGIGADLKAGYGVKKYPAVVVVDPSGKITTETLETLAPRLDKKS